MIFLILMHELFVVRVLDGDLIINLSGMCTAFQLVTLCSLLACKVMLAVDRFCVISAGEIRVKEMLGIE